MIRPARTADLDAIDAMSVRVIENMHANRLDQWQLSYPRRLHFAADIEKKSLYVYEEAGRIMGVMAVYEENETAYREITWMRKNSLVVHRILVDPSAQGRGIGDTLILYAVGLAKSQGKASLKIDTHPANHPMRRLLKKHQFEEQGYLKQIHRIAYERLASFDFMNKIMIFGNSGTGKTTLARMLADKLGMDALHLDTVYWRKNWETVGKNAFDRQVRTYMMKHPRFIMDGNYTGSRTFLERIRLADTIIMLSYPTKDAIHGVLERGKQYKHRYRSDMASGCVEELDQEFLKYVAFFRPKRHRIEGILNGVRPKKNILVFNSRKALLDWFNSL